MTSAGPTPVTGVAQPQRLSIPITSVDMDTEPLTLANLEEQARRIVETARAVNAPPDAAVRLEPSKNDSSYNTAVMYDTPPGRRHAVTVGWALREDESEQGAGKE